MRTLLMIFVFVLVGSGLQAQLSSIASLNAVLQAQGEERNTLLKQEQFLFRQARTEDACLHINYAGQAAQESLTLTVCDDSKSLTYHFATTITGRELQRDINRLGIVQQEQNVGEEGTIQTRYAGDGLEITLDLNSKSARGSAGSITVTSGFDSGADALFCETLLLVSQSVNARFESIMGSAVTNKNGEPEKWHSQVELTECSNNIYPVANYRVFSAECLGVTTGINQFRTRIDGCLDVLPGWQLGGNSAYPGHYIDANGNEIRLIAGPSNAFKVDVHPGL